MTDWGIQSIKKTHQYITFYVYCFYFYLQTLAPSNPFLLSFLCLRDVWRRSRWPADPRTTLRAPAPTGPSRATFVGLAAILHRRTGLTGYPDRSDRSGHRRCNCAVAHRAIKRIHVLVLDWHQQGLARISTVLKLRTRHEGDSLSRWSSSIPCLPRREE